ncbi:MAG: squalene synthase HpnC [Phycisphaerales bacterium]|nr:squalene synthase HpnC [Phycisphaerales bacterium]
MSRAQIPASVAWPPAGQSGASRPSLGEARQFCRTLATGHYENFSVISSLLQADLRSDFAAVYAFCRGADDLGDESGTPERALELLAWWREELQQCFAGNPSHPVFVALRETISRHDLPEQPFLDLIGAFELDQKRNRWDRFTHLLDYCRGSANPVGRLVLMMMGSPREERLFRLSDAVCTALQLTNHWQDVRRDLLQNNRIYIPKTLWACQRFEERLLLTAQRGFAPDRAFLESFRRSMRACVERTWRFYQMSDELLSRLPPRHRAVVWLFTEGGRSVLRQIEEMGYETVITRPRLGKIAKASLIARAWWRARG